VGSVTVAAAIRTKNTAYAHKYFNYADLTKIQKIIQKITSYSSQAWCTLQCVLAVAGAINMLAVC